MADIIVIGASMGGVLALKKLVRGLPGDLPAAVFVVQHVGLVSEFHLPQILDSLASMECRAAVDGDAIQHGRVLIAPPDRHLVLKPDRVTLANGPHENRSRPAVDVLFRSAAVAFGSRVVGVVLTGLQDDGSAGLVAVKRCGGLTIVQDPTTAEYPEMPRSAMSRTRPDYVLALDQIPDQIVKLAREPAGAAPPVPEDLAFEVRMSEGQLGDARSRDAAGQPSSFACPACGGVLWEVDDHSALRFRCRTGHAFTAASLIDEQQVQIEAALWAAIRALEERTQLLVKLARDAEAAGLDRLTGGYEERSRAALEHARTLRELLFQPKRGRASRRASGGELNERD